MPTYDCPICHRVVSVARREEAPYRPFCSHRCKMVDLGRWLDGTYTVSEPARPEDVDAPEHQHADHSPDADRN